MKHLSLCVATLILSACANPATWVWVEPEAVEASRHPDDSAVFFDLTVENLTARSLSWDWSWDGEGHLDMSVFRIGTLDEGMQMRVPFAGACRAEDRTHDGHLRGVLEIRVAEDADSANESGALVREIPVDLDCGEPI